MSAPGIAIIGTGWGAQVQVPGFRAGGLEIVALAGANADKTQQIAQEQAIPFATGNWRDVLERPEVDLVSILTPPHLHAEMAIAALEAGKHVLSEKPTARDAGDAEAMLMTARQFPEQLALIDHEMRFLPAVHELRRMVRQGELGTLRHVEMRRVMRVFPNDDDPWKWIHDADQGGGVLGATGSHLIDLLRVVLGEEVSAVRGLVTSAVRQRPDRSQPGETKPVTADEIVLLHLRTQSGCMATMNLSMVTGVHEPQEFTVYGNSGAVRLRDGKLEYASGKAPIWAERTPVHSVSFPPGFDGEYRRGTVYLAHALRRWFDGDGSALAPAATFADGLAVQRVLDAARRMGDAGWVSVE